MKTFRKTRFFLLVIASVFILSQPAYAKRVQPIQDIENAAIPPGLSMEQIKKAIIKAGAIRNWAVSEVSPGQLQATLHLRSHMAKVDIPFDLYSYSIRYNSSDNLKFSVDGKTGEKKIHRNYNSWVQNLNSDIQTTLSLLE